MGNFSDWFGRSYKGIIVVLVAVMAVALAVLAVQHVNSTRPEDGVAARPAPSFGTDEPTISPARITLPGAGEKVMILGDSWTAGYAADPKKGYATLVSQMFQWQPVIEGHSGSGYTRDGGDGTIPAVVGGFTADPDLQLLILDVGRNDTYVQHPQERTLAASTVDAAREKFPNAQIVLVGPAPLVSSPSGFFDVDRTLQSVAAEKQVGYISAYQGKWFSGADDVEQYVDRTKDDHPNNEGHAHYADKLAEALRDLSS